MVNGVEYRTTSEVATIVREFEDCTLPYSEWNHRAHLVVVMWYVHFLPEVEATERTINGIQRYNRANGIKTTPHGGYNETVTLFWLAIAQQFATNAYPEASFIQRVNGFVQTYGEKKDLLFEYYSRERIFSCKASQTWIEPDLKPLHCGMRE